MKEYIFGYGSLVCHHSRSLTVHSTRVIPAYTLPCAGLVREWCIPLHKHGLRSTVLGVRHVGPQRGFSVNGVLFAIESEQLDALDAREVGYTRMQVHKSFFAIARPQDMDLWEAIPDEIHVYLYHGQTTQHMSRAHRPPILLSYYQTVLNGFLQYGGDFQQHFRKTSLGLGSHRILDDVACVQKHDR